MYWENLALQYSRKNPRYLSPGDRRLPTYAHMHVHARTQITTHACTLSPCIYTCTHARRQTSVLYIRPQMYYPTIIWAPVMEKFTAENGKIYVIYGGQKHFTFQFVNGNKICKLSISPFSLLMKIK